MMDEKVEIEGLRELKKALKQLPRDLRVKVLQQSLRPSANLIRDVARAMAPRGKSFVRRSILKNGDVWEERHEGGMLRKAIVVRREKKKYQRNQAQVRIGVLHGGTKKVGNVANNVKTGGIDAWYWRFVEFGTSQQNARPFLVPAFESTKYAAAHKIKGDLRKGIERTARRLAKKR